MPTDAHNIPPSQFHAEEIWRGKAGSVELSRAATARRLASSITGRDLEICGGILCDRSTGEAVPDGLADDRAYRYASILLRDAEADNRWAGILDAGERGSYEAGGTLNKTTLRISPFSLENVARRSRKRARAAVTDRFKEFLRQNPGEAEGIRRRRKWRLGWKLVTLTMPHGDPGIRHLDSLDQIKIINGAWRRLTRSEWWLRTTSGGHQVIMGGVKGVEDKLTDDGPHVHIHSLLLSRYLDHDDLARNWHECLCREIEHQGLSLLTSTESYVDIRTVTPRAGNEQEVTPEEAILEVCKYLTKPSELIGLDADTLLALCDVSRWPRMFELFGTFREQRPQAATRLDTKCISGDLEAMIAHGKCNGRLGVVLSHPPAELVNGSVPGEFECTLLRFWQIADQVLSPPPKKRIRPPTWRDLIGQTQLSQWLRIMHARSERARRRRAAWILAHNPTCRIVSGTGEVISDTTSEHRPNIKKFPDAQMEPW